MRNVRKMTQKMLTERLADIENESYKPKSTSDAI